MPDATVLLGGRYRLDRLVERGDVADVWEGTDEVLARRVAVKVLHDEHTGSLAAARLSHPGIVRIYDALVEGDTSFVVMELVHGIDLRRLIADRGGRLSPRLAVSITAQVADALQHAHSRGVVHGAINTSTIVCDGDRAKIADFGITSGDEPADPRIDVVALGGVLYEMVCGRPLSALRPRQVVAGVPRELEDVIVGATESGPDARFQTAGDLRSALLAVDLDDDAVPLVDPDDDTPPAGFTPSFRESERSWFVPAFAIVLVAAAFAVVGVVFAGTDVGRDLLRRNRDTPPATAQPPAPVPVASVTAFDPLGDGGEHDDESDNLVDGDPTTTWGTSSYSRADFGGLKPGVGVVARLDAPATLRRIEVQSPSPGWRAEVYVASTASSSFPGSWGSPVATLTGTHEVTAADLPAGTRGGAVLVWLTTLPRDGGAFRGVLGELRLLA